MQRFDQKPRQTAFCNESRLLCATSLTSESRNFRISRPRPTVWQPVHAPSPFLFARFFPALQKQTVVCDHCLVKCFVGSVPSLFLPFMIRKCFSYTLYCFWRYFSNMEASAGRGFHVGELRQLI